MAPPGMWVLVVSLASWDPLAPMESEDSLAQLAPRVLMVRRGCQGRRGPREPSGPSVMLDVLGWGGPLARRATGVSLDNPEAMEPEADKETRARLASWAPLEDQVSREPEDPTAREGETDLLEPTEPVVRMAPPEAPGTGEVWAPQGHLVIPVDPGPREMSAPVESLEIQALKDTQEMTESSDQPDPTDPPGRGALMARVATRETRDPWAAQAHQDSPAHKACLATQEMADPEVSRDRLAVTEALAPLERLAHVATMAHLDREEPQGL